MKLAISIIIAGILMFSITVFKAGDEIQKKNSSSVSESPDKEQPMEHSETAVLASGCFWCTEAVFESLEGVITVMPGYTGGHIPDPTYDQVCSGITGHAEAAEIVFNPDIISYEQILDVFWHSHDPTTLNRQGNDIGTQYRSAVFYANETQRVAAVESKKAIEKSGTWKDPIVTEITKLGVFYRAETYHHDYFKRNPNQPYCAMVIAPKLNKVRAKYQDILK